LPVRKNAEHRLLCFFSVKKRKRRQSAAMARGCALAVFNYDGRLLLKKNSPNMSYRESMLKFIFIF